MTNPFVLDLPALVCFSTGRTSAYMLYRIIDAYGGISGNKVDGSALPEGLVVSFQNTGKEREESLAFGHEIETRWNVPLVWLEWHDTFDERNYLTKDGKRSLRRKSFELGKGYRVVSYETASRNGEPFKAMLTYYNQYRAFVGKTALLPNPSSRMCTAYLKIKTAERYMRMLGFADYDCALGIRKDEPKRFAAMMAENLRNSNPYFNVCPLYDAGVTKADVMAFWSRQPFNLALDPQSDEGNCDLCFLKRTDKIVRIMERTARFDEFWITAERQTGQTFRRDRPSYAELRRMIDTDDPRLNILLKRSPMERMVDCICGEPGG